MHTWPIIIRRRRPGFPLQEDSKATGHARDVACRPIFEGDASIRWIDVLDGAAFVRITRADALDAPNVECVRVKPFNDATADHQYDLVTPPTARRFILHFSYDGPNEQRQVVLSEVEALCREAGRADRFEWIKDMPIGQASAVGRSTICERIA